MLKLSEKNYIERDMSWMLFNRRILGGGAADMGGRGLSPCGKEDNRNNGNNGNNGGVASAVPRCSEKNKPG